MHQISVELINVIVAFRQCSSNTFFYIYTMSDIGMLFWGQEMELMHFTGGVHDVRANSEPPTIQDF